MVRNSWILATLMLAFPAAAVELRPITVETGTAGLLAAPVRLTNAAPAAVTCTAQIAHWYSLEVARAEAGADAEIALWFKPETGTFVLLNDKEENMPVEALWCGFAGRAYETRGPISLERKTGAEVSARTVTCVPEGERLACR